MNSVVVTAAGRGLRLGVPGGKQFLTLAGLPILARSVREFNKSPLVSSIVIVVNEQEVGRCLEEIVGAFELDKVVGVVPGGRERQHSVLNGLEALPPEADVVAIHDGARPLITGEMIEKCLSSLAGWDGVVPAVPLKDTPKLVSGESIEKTLERSLIWGAQTPQVFPVDLIKRIHKDAISAGFLATDDASLVERAGGRVRIIKGSEENIKITTPIDLVIAEAILKARESDK